MIKKGFTKPSERINRLRKMTVESTPYIESERAVLITESYVESEGLSPIIRRAKALDKIFNNIPITIREDELIVGSMTKSLRGAGIYPEFSCEWIEDALKTTGNGNIGEFQIFKETAEELEEVFKYWKGKTTSELAKSYMSQVADNCMKNQVFTIENHFYDGVGNICVDYGKVLEKGFRGIIFEVIDALKSMDVSDPEYIKKQQFYEAVVISYNAAIKFAHRYAAKAREMAESESREDRKAELLYIAEICDKVPEYGASNFYEACQSFWFVQVILQIESNGHSVSPGRFDQYMYKYYKNDKSITKEFAQELIDCIFIKLNDINRFSKKSLTKDSAVHTGLQNICIGGQNKEGLEVSNELSYMCMEATLHVKLQEPLLSIRICKETPSGLIHKAYEVAQLGLKVLSIYNDEFIIQSLINKGVTLNDARNYCIIGYDNPQCPNKTSGWYDSVVFNLQKVIDITLNNGKVKEQQLGPVAGRITDFKIIDEFYKAFKKQISFFGQYLVEVNNSIDFAHAERAPLPFLAALVDDCIGKGKSVQEGGAVYNFISMKGLDIDNRYNIREEKNALTEELKKYTMSFQEIESSLNIEKTIEERNKKVLKERLDNICLSDDDIDEVNVILSKCIQIYCNEIKRYRNPRGESLFVD